MNQHIIFLCIFFTNNKVKNFSITYNNQQKPVEICELNQSELIDVIKMYLAYRNIIGTLSQITKSNYLLDFFLYWNNTCDQATGLT